MNTMVTYALTLCFTGLAASAALALAHLSGM